MYTDRIAESSEALGIDYTGQIRQFSEIGVGGPTTITPRPWVCYAPGINPNRYTGSPPVQWQTPDGSVVPTIIKSDPATSNELFQRPDWGRLLLYRGSNYNSPDGEYCCVTTTVPSQRRCVTLSELVW